MPEASKTPEKEYAPPQGSVALACDHGGYMLKLEIIRHLESRGIAYKDYGTHSQESVSYAAYGELAARAVAGGEHPRGIIICGTGIGISIAANKVAGIRAALCGDPFSAKMSRMHNDANMLALGARVIGTGLALEIVDAWLGAGFEGGRHKDRIGMIAEIEAGERNK